MADLNELKAFEANLSKLETLVETFEQGDLDLSKAINLYEKGVGLVKTCQSALEQAELRIETLTGAPSTPDSQA